MTKTKSVADQSTLKLRNYTIIFTNMLHKVKYHDLDFGRKWSVSSLDADHYLIALSQPTTLLSNPIQHNHELATSNYCHRFNLSSLSRQRRNLEGKKRSAFVVAAHINLYAEGEAFLDV
ncbi:hypothetical protein KKE54_07180 [bacterium]|nr:hypothetical protein [bacterium]